MVEVAADDDAGAVVTPSAGGIGSAAAASGVAAAGGETGSAGELKHEEVGVGTAVKSGRILGNGAVTHQQRTCDRRSTKCGQPTHFIPRGSFHMVCACPMRIRLNRKRPFRRANWGAKHARQFSSTLTKLTPHFYTCEFGCEKQPYA